MSLQILKYHSCYLLNDHLINTYFYKIGRMENTYFSEAKQKKRNKIK